MFPLCRTCVETLQQTTCEHTDEDRTLFGTWVSIELKKALLLGYKVLHIYEIWHYKETTMHDSATKTGGLFTDYMEQFLKLKQQASGFPDWVKCDKDKSEYVNSYYEHEGILLDPSKIEKNPGLRALAKLMCNSFWGKLGQRNNMTKTEHITGLENYFDLTTKAPKL